MEHVNQMVNKAHITYDRAEDKHFDTLSAFMKSLRGSDPDAAIFYLAKLLEGGDIIAMSKYLIGNIRSNEEYISQVDTIARRKYVEIGVLWTISLSIVVVLRFALSQFYDRVKGQLLFIVSLSMVFAFVLFTIYMLVQKGTSLKLKGTANHEKVA